MTRATLFAAFLALAAVPALAQPAQQTPSQIALQLQQIIGNWAQAIEALQKQNAELQQQNAALSKERDELKAKLPKQPAQN